ncbi:MAG TPA: helix-turn-helix domain-containing protein [Fimbriiglobus sp.]
MQTSGYSFSKLLTDFDQLAGYFAKWDGRFEQLSAGRFAGRLSLVRGRTVRLSSVDCNQVILARGRDDAGLFKLYTVTPANAGGLWQGRRLAPGQLVVHGPEADTDHITGRRINSVGFTVPAGEMEAAARSLLGGEFKKLPHSWAALTPSPDLYAEVSARFQAMLNMALADPTILTSTEGALLEQECIRAVVRSVVPVDSSRPDTPPHRRTAVAHRAEELMRAHLYHPVGVVDLCAKIGVSDRTLRLAFRERFGIGPMTYYRRVRLSAARTALKTDSSTGVAEVARQFGFHHVGNFAADFRRLFGERPSETHASAMSSCSK